MSRQVKTVKLQGNVEYAKVATRLLAFHEENDHCSIITTINPTASGVVISAEVTTKRGTFTGHSYCATQRLTSAKQFEKQETIAVGRALAFAGYLASGEIASVEEMDEYDGATQPHVPEVTLAALTSLKLQYAAANSDLTKAEKAAQFPRFVENVTGRDFDSGDFRQWTSADLAKCREQLAYEASQQEGGGDAE